MNNFESSWHKFVSSGDFLSFSLEWEHGISESKRFKLPNGLSAKLFDTGLLQIEPNQPSQTKLLISSGVHGNETAPMEIMQQIVDKIWKGQLTVNVNLMLVIGNPPATNLGKRFLDQNLNRLFSKRYLDSKTQDYETERAKTIESAVTQFFTKKDQNQTFYHFDLHTAIRPSQYEKFVVYPFMHDKPWDLEHIAFFGGSDITTILLGNHPAGTFSYFTSNQFDALSATVELGKVKPFGENDMNKFSGIYQNLCRLIEDKPTHCKKFDNDIYKIFKVKQEIIKANTEFKLLLSDDVKNFTSFNKGTLLASDGKNENYFVEQDGESIVFPNNNVPVGQRVGVLLKSVKL